MWPVLSFFVCWIYYLDTNCVDVFDDILLRIFGYVSAYLDLVQLVFSASWVLIYLPKDFNSQLMLDDQDHCPSNELYSNFHTLPGDCFVFPPISAILGAFLTICFQPFAVLLFLAQCSAAPAVITSRRWNGQPGSTFQLAAKLLSDGKTQWRSRGLVTASRDPTYASPNVR